MENIDVEYEKEQRILEAKRQKYNQIEEKRRKYLCGTSGDKMYLQLSYHWSYLLPLSSPTDINSE